MKPVIPLHDVRFRYIRADTHTDSQLFRQRQERRREQAQRPNNVAPIRKERA